MHNPEYGMERERPNNVNKIKMKNRLLNGFYFDCVGTALSILPFLVFVLSIHGLFIARGILRLVIGYKHWTKWIVDVSFYYFFWVCKTILKYSRY